MNAIKELATLFSYLTWTCFGLKENTFTHSFQKPYSKQTKHPLQGFLYGEIRCLIIRGNWGWGRVRGVWVLPTSEKFQFPPSARYHPRKLSIPVHRLITDHILEKKVSLIAFSQILPKMLPVVCTFNYTIMNCKSSFELNPLIQDRVQQDYLLALYLIIFLNLYGKLWG